MLRGRRSTAALDYADFVTDDDPDDGEHVVPGELRRFLARLRLLHGVPFSYLVPDAELLPIESIRFFYIDRAWTDALVQGALSVGTISTADRAQLEARLPAHPQRGRRGRAHDPHARRAKSGSKAPAARITGFLMRSRAVSGWPNLHVRAYSRDVVADDALTTAAESRPEPHEGAAHGAPRAGGAAGAVRRRAGGGARRGAAPGHPVRRAARPERAAGGSAARKVQGARQQHRQLPVPPNDDR